MYDNPAVFHGAPGMRNFKQIMAFFYIKLDNLYLS